MSINSGKLEVINGLRGLAIIAVYLVHTLGSYYKPGDFWLADIAGTGWFGVELFFVLSGFVLYLPFAEGIQLNAKLFYVKRLKRLYPLFIIASLISLIFFSDKTTINIEFWWEAVKLFTTLFFPFNRAGFGVGNEALWSLAIEFYLSAIFPFLVWLLMRSNKYKLGIFIFCIAFIFESLYALYGHDQKTSLFKLFVFTQALADFYIGMFIAVTYKDGTLVKYLKNPTLLAISAAVMLMTFLINARALQHNPFICDFKMLFWPCANILLGIFVASCVIMTKGYIWRILTNPILQLTGIICYSIYIWHMPFLRKLAPVMTNDQNVFLFTFSAFIFIFIFAMLSYRFIEYPNLVFKDLFARVFKRMELQKRES